MDHGDKDELLDRIYAVAIEPERFHELVDVWQQQLSRASGQVDYSFSYEPELLNHHLDRAGTIMSMVEENAHYFPQPLFEKLNTDPQATIAFAEDGKIEAANDAAKSMFSIDNGGHINNLPFEQDGLEQLKSISRKLFNNAKASSNTPPDLCRLTMLENDTPLLATLTLWETAGNRRFLIFKTAGFIWPDHLSPLVQTAFQLTPAEVDVMRLLVQGSPLEEVAKMRSTSLATVRTQVRSIYAKTSTRNQSEFLRMAIGLTTLKLSSKSSATGVFETPAEVTEHCFPLPDHRRILTLADGRHQDYMVFGPEDGIPCLHFHGDFFGDIWPSKLANLALQNRLRIVAPARAYYSETSPYPDGVLSYEQTSEDIEALLDHLGVEKILAVAQLWGMQYAIHFASTRPSKVKAIVGVAPYIPISSEDDLKKMSKFTKFMANVDTHKSGAHKSRVLEFVLKSGYFFHNRVGSKRFLETILTRNKTDAITIRDPNNLAAIIQGFKFSSTNEHKAMFNDHRQTMAPYDRQSLIELACRTYAIIGTGEISRIERAEKLIKEGAKLSIVDADAGGNMLFYSHPELVVETIRRAWEEAKAN